MTSTFNVECKRNTFWNGHLTKPGLSFCLDIVCQLSLAHHTHYNIEASNGTHVIVPKFSQRDYKIYNRVRTLPSYYNPLILLVPASLMLPAQQSLRFATIK